MNRLTGTIFLTFALASPAAFAQESLLEYVIDACETDLVEYCDQVTPGEGRMLYCVAAHEDKISSDCAYALYDAADVLRQLTNAIVYLAESCETEITEYCSETPLGEGRVLACLAQRSDELSESCRTAIDETVTVE